MQIAKSVLIPAFFILSGCASGWIADPSPQVRGFVSDLKLEGFDCNATFRAIECIQESPIRVSQASICDSKSGCVERPDHLIYNKYIIVQSSSGIPQIEYKVIRREDSLLKPKVTD
tara:strand:- start:5447 stop:5794 length:348 start_codon:yes stop_codon:yes gene_type:complete